MLQHELDIDPVHRELAGIAELVEARGLALHGPNRELFIEPLRVGTLPVIEMLFPVRTATRIDSFSG